VNRSVLIVDDDPAFRRLAYRMLLAAGLTVTGEAGDVAEAIVAANQCRPDAVLVDLHLPDGNGIDLARELVALSWRPRVLLTSSDEVYGALAGTGDEELQFVPKEDLPNAPLGTLLGAQH
jgi:DNA-binding NarL/FixJ family response regulator